VQLGRPLPAELYKLTQPIPDRPLCGGRRPGQLRPWHLCLSHHSVVERGTAPVPVRSQHIWPRSSAHRASVCGTEGRRWDSCRGRHIAVAQSDRALASVPFGDAYGIMRSWREALRQWSAVQLRPAMPLGSVAQQESARLSTGRSRGQHPSEPPLKKAESKKQKDESSAVIAAVSAFSFQLSAFPLPDGLTGRTLASEARWFRFKS
jgi:hypothetical protein